MGKRKPISLQQLFGDVARDIQQHAQDGYPHALTIDNPDALQEALDIATLCYNLTNPDMRFSPPNPAHHQTGYIVLKDEEIATVMQQELLRCGFECMRTRDCQLQPLPRFF
jgi:hypothetical protein